MESKRTVILHWIEQGLVSEDKAAEALRVAGILPDAQRWQHFLTRLMLWLGALALAFSLMFFIAYNWDAMGRFARFALIEVCLVVSLAIYWKLDVDKMAARASLVVASMLVGVLLAFYGQTYQTGADPWQLFANWALLIFPWVVVGQFAALWLLWVALLNVAMLLYFHAMGGLFWLLIDSTENMLWSVFVVNTLVWLLWERMARSFSWLAERWAVRLVAVASGSALTLLMVFGIFDHYDSRLWTMLVYLLWVAALYGVYRNTIRDLFMLAGLCLSVIIVLTTQVGDVIFDGSDGFAFFVLANLVIGMAAVAAIWLKKVYREQQA